MVDAHLDANDLAHLIDCVVCQSIYRDAADTTRSLGTQFRVRYIKRGGHVHCRLFQRHGENGTWQKNGDAVFDEQAWAALSAILPFTGVFELLPESP